MNQILLNFNYDNKKNKKRKLFFKIILYISILIIFCAIIYFLSFAYTSDKEEKLSSFFKSSFNIERLYSDGTGYTTIELNNGGNFFVIGLINIPKINIEYPILSNTTDELLKMAPCRFYGPYPNKTGNLCIAAHNYDDNRFFSNLYKLNIGDIINIYDSSNSCITYSIYQKYEISIKDTSCTDQNTNGVKEITLVTCNNINKNRLIIKAREKKQTI